MIIIIQLLLRAGSTQCRPVMHSHKPPPCTGLNSRIPIIILIGEGVYQSGVWVTVGIKERHDFSMLEYFVPPGIAQRLLKIM